MFYCAYVHMQGFIQDFKLGGGNPCFVEAGKLGGSGGMPPQKIFDLYIL